MKKALIIGIDSTIGSFLCNELVAANWLVFGTTRRREYVNKQNGIIYLDLSKTTSFSFEPEVDVVFLCASMTSIKDCRNNPAQCELININAQIQLTEYFSRKRTFIVFLSTSAVFNGRKKSYEINDVTCPTTVYGTSKAIAESKISKISNNVAIVRLSKVLTPTYPLFIKWIEQLKSNIPVEPFYDLYLCPIFVGTVVSCLRQIAEKKPGGIMHLSGDEDISYEKAAEYLANLLGADHSLIQPKSAASAAIPLEETPRYTKLNMFESRKLLNIPNTSLSATFNNLYNIGAAFQR